MAGSPAIIVPLPSAFTDDTSTLSEVRVSRLVRFHLERGAQGFLTNGLSGDPFQLGHAERKQLLEWVLREAKGLPVFANVTATTTSGTLDLCQHAARHGAKAAIVCPPPVGRYSLKEAQTYLNAMQRHGNVPVYFADPDGVWDAYVGEGFAVGPVGSVEEGTRVLPHSAPDECVIGDAQVTPLAMFGADCYPRFLERSEAFVPAVRALVEKGGLGRATRAALLARECDIGTARSPVFDLPDEARKMLSSIVSALG